jgi:hypothetical protein
MSGQNVYFDVTIDNNPAGRITFKVNTKKQKKIFGRKIFIYFSSSS